MEQIPPPESQPSQLHRRYAEVNSELVVELIDIPVEKLAGAMLNLGNLCQLLATSHNEDAQSNSDLREMEALMSFVSLEMVSRTMSSFVPARTLTSIWRALARTSLSKKEVQLIRELIREVELMQSTDFTE